MWPSMTFEFMLHSMEKLRLLKLSFTNLYKNLLINEYARNILAKTPE